MTEALLDGTRVNVGSGPEAAPGWVNIDASWQAWLAARPRLARLARRVTGRQVGHWSPAIVCHDVRRPLPFADGAAAIVFASHVVEHLSRAEAVRFLRDARRVLCRGGVCRIIVPDVEAIARTYLRRAAEGDEDGSDQLMEQLHVHGRGGDAASGWLNAYRRWTAFDHHKWMYDARGACRLLREAGFADVRQREYLESAIPRAWLELVERPDRVLNGSGVCVEGRREEQ